MHAQIGVTMKRNGIYEIPFVGLKEGKHQFEYQIERKFFDAFDFDEFNDVNVLVTLEFVKKTTLFELHFHCKGWVEVPCDISNELFHQPIDNDLNLIVKFGEEYDDTDDELLIIPHGEYKINIAQYLYEMIVLSVPVKRIHPGVLDGTLHSDVLDKLNELEQKQEIPSSQFDARWEKLKEIK